MTRTARPVQNAVLASLLMSLGISAPAWGAGFELPGNSAQGIGRGMALTAAVDDSTAVAHNPGRLAQQKGNHVQWSHQIIMANETFTRSKSTVVQDPVPGTNDADALKPSSNKTPLFPLGAFAAASTDFGMADWTFALAGYGPSAVGHKEFDSQGGQKYMLTKLDALLAYASAAVAYGKKDQFGIGATLQWAMMPKTDMSLVVDASTGGPQNPYYAGNDAVATIRLKDMTAFSAIVGGWYRLTEALDIALSGRVMPVEFEAEGDLILVNDKPGAGANFSQQQLSVTNSKAKLAMKLAPTASLGLRYRMLKPDGAESMDAEVDVVWEGWSVLNEYNVINSGKINLFAAQDAPNVKIAKKWQDTLSVRLGTTYWYSPDLGVSLGTYYEQGATPLDYSHLDFPSFDRIGAGMGVRYKYGPVSANLSLAHVEQETRVVEEQWGQVQQQRPLAPCPTGCSGFTALPANAGKFETSYEMLSWSLSAAF